MHKCRVVLEHLSVTLHGRDHCVICAQQTCVGDSKNPRSMSRLTVGTMLRKMMKISSGMVAINCE